MSYDPRNINQMYEQYSRTHGGSSNKGSTYDETPQTITRGLGTPLGRSFSTRDDDDDDKKDDVGGVRSFFSDVFSLFTSSGAEPKEPPSFEGSSVYDRKEFKPITYDPTENRITVTGYNPNTAMRSSDEIMGDVDTMFDRSDDAGYTPDPALGSTYDEVKEQDKPPTTIEDAINTAIENTIPTAGYKVKRGDTLSEIAQATGRTVRELQQLNDITDPRKMQAGSTLKIPVQTAQDIEVVEGARSMSELRPLRTANQSMMTGSQREYEPETGFEGMGPDPSVGKGIMTPRSSEGFGGMGPDPSVDEGMTFDKMKKDFVEGYLVGHEGTKAHKSLEGGKDTAAFGVKNALGLKRSDYESDKDFATAVALKHYDQTKKDFIFDFVWDELGEAGRYALADLHYNAGTVGSSAVKGTAKEAITNTLNYVGMTTKDGTKASLLSLSKRRAENWNKAADSLGLDKIDKIQQMPRSGGGTVINYLNEKGDVIHQVSSGRKPVTLNKDGTYKELTETKEVEIK